VPDSPASAVQVSLLLTVQHGAEAGAAGPVPAGSQGAVQHSAQAAVPVSTA
jgi:hypothetical protein